MQQCKTLLWHELKAFVTNEILVAQKELISENQRCDPQSQNKINEPTVKSVVQPLETTNRAPILTKLPVTVSNEQSMRSCNVFEPHEVIRNHHEWHDALDNSYTK
jgi:hypothetical protein